MADTLYDTDILSWSEQQADLLRRAARGERVNGLDWPNLIEEIEAVGRSELHAVESLLGQALLHMLKAVGWPESAAAAHWRGEALGFLLRAARQFAPSMRQRLDIADLYRDALVEARSYRNRRPAAAEAAPDLPAHARRVAVAARRHRPADRAPGRGPRRLTPARLAARRPRR